MSTVHAGHHQMSDTNKYQSGMKGYRITPEEMRNMSHQTLQTAEGIQTQLNALRLFVTDLEHQWHGVASGTFNALMADWDIYAHMLHQSLVGISDGLKGNYVNYTNSEESNISNLRTVHGQLPGGPVGVANLD
jgi:WXG100 family type VII secretion target